jgi:radical SAM superfamily enzyme YgiQ (UPF0313 family)
MNILLINPSLRPDSKVKLFPVGLGYIATAIKTAGYKFDLLDIDAYRYTDEYINNYFKNKKFDIVCMGCIVTGYKYVKEICALVRKHNPNAVIIIGNSVATSIYKTLLTRTEADVAVMGEGDITIIELLQYIEANKGDNDFRNIKGISYKDRQGEICLNEPRPQIENISNLPFLDFTLFDTEIYIDNSKEQIPESDALIARDKIRSLPVNTARGCIANCTFCYHNFRGYKYRYRSVDSILAEIAILIKKYNLNYIAFSDELSIFSRKRAIELAEAILNSGLKFFWRGTCRADCFTNDDDIEIMKQLKAAGCVGMTYSLESADEEILKAMNKHITVNQFAKTTRLFYQAGITPTTSIVIGYPEETEETIKKTFDVCADCCIYPSTGYLLPQPGSVMYDYARENGFIGEEEEYLLRMGDRQDLRINMSKISDDKLETSVLEGLRKVNSRLNTGLAEHELIKTQYYRKSET